MNYTTAKYHASGHRPMGANARRPESVHAMPTSMGFTVISIAGASMLLNYGLKHESH